MSDLYLSRAWLRRDAPVAALRELLVPDEHGPRTAAAHRLVWTLFADTPDRARDFLWREGEPGAFYLLSARPPADRHGLFRLDPPKPFAPALAPGDRLSFVLRANATVSRKPGGPVAPGVRGARHDVVMDALAAVPPGERAAARPALLSRVAHEWLSRQGELYGFHPDASHSGDAGGEVAETSSGGTHATGYRVLRVDRGRRTRPLQVGVLDIQGTLTVREPARFIAGVAQGIGRAKAFGCGLMLLRRAS